MSARELTEGLLRLATADLFPQGHYLQILANMYILAAPHFLGEKGVSYDDLMSSLLSVPNSLWWKWFLASEASGRGSQPMSGR